MRAVGIRELKAKLSEYVALAKKGEIVLVTERGRVVAELRPPITTKGLAPELEPFRELAERGLVTLGLPNDPSVYDRDTGIRCPDGTAQELLRETRKDKWEDMWGDEQEDQP